MPHEMPPEDVLPTTHEGNLLEGARLPLTLAHALLAERRYRQPSFNQPHIRHSFPFHHFAGSVSRMRKAVRTRRGFLRWTDMPSQ